ncbi:MAG: T9SS type A sorting domain-containing protein [Crocinitomicaceae bacterium]
MRLFTLFLLIFSNFALTQSVYNLEFNNVLARIQDNGVFFQNPVMSQAAYEFPKGSNQFAIYSMGYWMGGKDVNSQVHLAGQMYGLGSDYFPGPIANDYNSAYYQYNFLSSIWPISKSTIDDHIANYSTQGYTPDQSILNWPGNGNTSEGVAAQLAPYVDVNQNQIYDPLNGDYPLIIGDFAVYTIMNDAANIHTESGGEILGVEIHSMFYQYTTNDDLNNTTFLHLKIYNRGTTTYNDFIYGIWMDPDIGYAQNDFVGCDTLRNLGFAYNGESTDNGGSGQNPYGTSPPAVGAVFLSDSMHAFVYHGTGGGSQGTPTTPAQYYLYLDGLWNNGAPFTYGGTGLGGTDTTTYIFSGNPNSGTGWSEVTESNAPGDRRFLMSTYLGELTAYSDKCVDIAFVINNDSSDHLMNVENLFNTTDFVQDFYDNNITPCEQITASIPDYNTELKISFYPNPAEDNLYINVGTPFQYLLTDLKGAVVLAGNSNESSTYLNIDMETGMYVLQIKTENGFAVEKLQVK